MLHVKLFKYLFLWIYEVLYNHQTYNVKLFNEKYDIPRWQIQCYQIKSENFKYPNILIGTVRYFKNTKKINKNVLYNDSNTFSIQNWILCQPLLAEFLKWTCPLSLLGLSIINFRKIKMWIWCWSANRTVLSLVRLHIHVGWSGSILVAKANHFWFRQDKGYLFRSKINSYFLCSHSYSFFVKFVCCTIGYVL